MTWFPGFTPHTPDFPLALCGVRHGVSRNPYAGTVFNLILGLLTAAVALYLGASPSGESDA